MTIPSLPTLDRTSPTFRSDLDTFFLTQLPATTVAFNAEAERLNAIGYGSYNATSTTSLTIGTGAKSLTVETGRGFAVGQALLIASTASPTNYMSGQVTSYDSGAGALVFNATTSNGSGTLAAWTVSITALAGGAPTVLQRSITGTDTLIASDQGKLINASGTFTLAVTAAATLGNGWYCWLRNTSNGDVTVDPASTEQIDGATTFVLRPGFTVLVACGGTAFTTMRVKERTYSNIASYTASGTFVVPADTYVIRGYAWGKGGDSTTDTSGGGGGCAYGDIAVTPGETVSITISSGVATVTTGGTARLTANAASGTTAGTASKHASVTNGGNYSGGAGGTGGGGGASGSPLGVGGGAGSTGGSAWGGFISFAPGGAGVGQGGGGGGIGTNTGGGSLRKPTNQFTDPLLAPLTGAGGIGSTTSSGGPGGPGGGGGGTSASGQNAGMGGVGGGGGGSLDAGGGPSLFGGGGGYGGTGGEGGLGGGGAGVGTSAGTTGGAACVLIYY